jgi:hypothetical protein
MTDRSRSPMPSARAWCGGHPVRWRGTLEEALDLPGMYEMMDGWLYVRRT